jgi:hypothetical protein
VNSEKYIGLDVHQATISVAVMDPRYRPGHVDIVAVATVDERVCSNKFLIVDGIP